ncbi:Hypothetical protein A7982_02585 [Minicystis rosea]|nr:Hypothetical protein A7982_02585 [Minicystis rosea]
MVALGPSQAAPNLAGSVHRRARFPTPARSSPKPALVLDEESRRSGLHPIACAMTLACAPRGIDAT